MTAAVLLLYWGQPAAAQDAAAELVGVDLTGAVGTQFRLDGVPEEIRQAEGFFYGAGVRSTYNSNLFLNESGEVDDIIIALNPFVRYRSAPPQGARVVATAVYSPSYTWYLDNPDLDRLNHFANATLQLNGDRSSANARVSWIRSSDSNRFAGTFTDTDTYSGSLGGSYEVSPKTSAAVNFGYIESQYDRIGSSDYKIYNMGLTGWWEATPLIRIGPSIRYSQTDSDNAGDREAWALLGRLTYRLTGKVNLSASAGVEWQELDNDGETNDGTVFTGSLSADWTIDDLWSLSVNTSYRNTPSLSTENYYINNFNFAVRVTRNLAKGSVQGGFSYDNSDYEQSGPSTADREGEDFWTLFANYQRPLFREALFFSTFLSYSDNSGSEDWNNVQFSAGLDYVF